MAVSPRNAAHESGVEPSARAALTSAPSASRVLHRVAVEALHGVEQARGRGRRLRRAGQGRRQREDEQHGAGDVARQGAHDR